MKLDCHIVRDLLAQYIEGLVSCETADDIAAHLSECESCTTEYENMKKPVSAEVLTPVYGAAENMSGVEYLRKYKKKRKGLITALIIIAGLLLIVCFNGILALTGACAVFLTGERDVSTDVAQYAEYLGEDGKYRTTYFGTDEIFPAALPSSAKVEEYYYEYYNPWDANNLGYLVYTCSNEDFAAEYDRLNALERTDYLGVYGTESFPYELCAVSADENYGMTYALADSAYNRLIYFGLDFCNYFTDIDYKKHVDAKYLPIGFDAANGNATRKAFERGALD